MADPQPFSQIDQQAQWTRDGFAYDIFREVLLQPGEEAVLDIPWGVGYEGVAAATSAKELLRQGFDAAYAGTSAWLAAREKRLNDPALHELLGTNLFFAFFYASGRTIDTEELCLMTSRSPRYYVSAAYWDRDSLLWAFPAILMADAAYAREILIYVFTKQIRNVGLHSRYIDGTLLEPGFELDELCAPVIALGATWKVPATVPWPGSPPSGTALRPSCAGWKANSTRAKPFTKPFCSPRTTCAITPT